MIARSQLTLFAVTAISLSAQSNTATILGNVTDSSGASIPGVKVTITNVKTQIVRSTVTGQSGAFELPLIPVGEYAIAAEMTRGRSGAPNGPVSCSTPGKRLKSTSICRSARWWRA